MKKTFSLLLLCLIFGGLNFSFKPTSSKIVADKSNSVIIYSMKHPMHDWDAKNKDVNCVMVLNDATKAIEQVAVSVRVDAFDSGNANRDSHALEVLEALKYPKITFSSTKIIQNGNKLLINGNLNFHNVSKLMTFEAIRRDEKEKIFVEGLFYVSLTDHKVERPSLVGIKCEDEIKLCFKVEFQDKKISTANQTAN